MAVGGQSRPLKLGSPLAFSLTWPAPWVRFSHPFLPRAFAPLPSAGASPRRGNYSMSTAIMDKKRSPNRLIVDEATNDDNSVRSQQNLPCTHAH